MSNITRYKIFAYVLLTVVFVFVALMATKATLQNRHYATFVNLLRNPDRFVIERVEFHTESGINVVKDVESLNFVKRTLSKKRIDRAFAGMGKTLKGKIFFNGISLDCNMGLDGVRGRLVVLTNEDSLGDPNWFVFDYDKDTNNILLSLLSL